MEQLNQDILKAAEKYLNPDNTCSLIHRDESPNANIIYHLHYDGEITSEKGGWAYGQRSTFTSAYPVRNNDRLRFTFRYVVLPYEECLAFRKRMEELANPTTTQTINPIETPLTVNE